MTAARTSLVCIAVFFAAGAAHAQARMQTSLELCTTRSDATARLSCFDSLAAAEAAARHHSTAEPAPQLTDTVASRLEHQWELGKANEHRLFSIRPHRQNYILIANYSSAPNEEPFRDFKPITPSGQRSGFLSTETKYQLSLKTKLMQDLTPLHIDIWGAYTQQSQWQAYNRKGSSPFRDTNYQPELMAVLPLDIPILGTRMRFLNVGLVHQSNGQALTLSRSWDRLYAEVGLERGNFSLLVRVWQRRPEHGNDNNDDIIDYMGRGDVVAAYHYQGHNFSVSARGNVSKKHGALQADWAFPLAPHLKGYIQSSTGYGQSLIDYNHKQTTFGIGLLMDY